MKYFVFTFFAFSIFWGCSGSIDTTTLTPDDHLKYAMTLYAEEDYEEALTEFQSILLQYPASPVNDDSQFYLGMTYFRREQYLLSAYEFSKLIRDIPTSPFLSDAQFMLANSYYELSPDFRLDPAYTSKAIEEFQAFIDFFPADERVEEAEIKINEMNLKLAEKSFNAARIYEKMEYFNAAIEYYSKTVDTYHDTPFAAEAYYRKIKILLTKLRVEEAIRDMESFLNMYPESEFTVEIGQIYEEYSQFN
jgi:outer membrane protein assembly factor BamD